MGLGRGDDGGVSSGDCGELFDGVTAARKARALWIALLSVLCWGIIGLLVYWSL